MFVVRLIGVFVLVALNGFFAATEFSLVAVRLSRIRQLVAKGSARARVVESLLGDLHRVVSGVQLGITIVSLTLGWVGEPVLARMMESLIGNVAYANIYAHTVAIAIAFTAITCLHVILGELVPKSLALQRAEQVALTVAALLATHRKVR